jgi:hypothetical protein
MTKEQLAAALDCREYKDDIAPDLLQSAFDNKLLIIEGGSDDLCEFYGAFREEVGCYEGGKIRFNKLGEASGEDDSEDGESEMLPHKLEAVWGKKDDRGHECSWQYRTSLPHAKYDVMEGGELYCVGMVIDLKEI